MKTGTGNKGLDWFFVFGMLAAYPKTADLLSLFSPKILNDLFGMDMSLPYGAFCAALVEGTVLFLHFDRRAHRVGSAVWVKWILTGVSFLCQVFDGYVTTDSLSLMSPTLKLVLQFGIPSLPLIIAVMIAAIGALPDEEEISAKPSIGLKGWWNKVLNGNSEFSPKVVEQVEKIFDEEDKVNPTNRRP